MDTEKIKSTALGGIINNPVFVLVLGTCPMLAQTTKLESGMWLGLATMIVLVVSNVIISLLRNIIPQKVRIPCYIILVATIATVVDLFLQRFMPALYKEIGAFVMLIVVNCIILARAEAFASSNSVGYSLIDGVSMGLGFTAALSLLGTIRELLSAGSIYGITILGDWFPRFSIFAQTAGGFIMLGLLMALFNYIYSSVYKRQKAKAKLLRAG